MHVVHTLLVGKLYPVIITKRKTSGVDGTGLFLPSSYVYDGSPHSKSQSVQQGHLRNAELKLWEVATLPFSFCPVFLPTPNLGGLQWMRDANTCTFFVCKIEEELF